MSYYYFVASLPALSLGAPPPLDRARFEADAARLLSPEDVLRLRTLADGEGDDAFAARWRSMETQLRNAAARVRAARLGVDAAPHLRTHAGFSVHLEAAVTDAYAKPNPMDRELTLDRFRWQFLDEASRGDPFGFAAVQAYALKLRIAERWAALTDEAGAQRLQEAVAAVRKAAAPGEAA